MGAHALPAGQAALAHSCEQRPPVQATVPLPLRSGMHIPVAHSRLMVQAEPSDVFPDTGMGKVQAPVAMSQTRKEPQLHPRRQSGKQAPTPAEHT